MELETVIGLEIHCELKTRTKIFCSCPNRFAGPENEYACPVCLGMPGALPSLNRKAVELAVKAGHALNCTVSTVSVMDRKNYFYPDLPKAYQISQFDLPLCTEGHLDIEASDGTAKRVRILRIHMEEDAGKLSHDPSGSLLDVNRCGVPLIEIVTYPDMSSPAEAERFARKVKSILEFAGVTDARMQEGSLRFDVNLSVRRPGEALGVRTEMKNLNSFRSLVRSAAFEAERQAGVIASGGRVVQETRRWDEVKGVSRAMRSKEDADDYRYFPDPDLCQVLLSEEEIARLRDELPDLPDKRKAGYAALGLPEADAALLVRDLASSVLFDEAFAGCGQARLSADLVRELGALAGEDSDERAPLAPGSFGRLAALAGSGQISRATAKRLLREMAGTGAGPDEILSREGATQISSRDEIIRIVDEVIAANPAGAADVRSGNVKAVSFLVGQAMKRTGGRANPALVNECLMARLSSDTPAQNR